MPNLLPRAPHPAPPLRGPSPAPAPTPGAQRTARERIGLAVLAVERAGRGALARVRRSRLLRWRYRAPAVEELLLAPPDLRGRDTSFADEAAAGSFGLAGFVATLGGRSPFAVEPPSPALGARAARFRLAAPPRGVALARGPVDGRAAPRPVDANRARAQCARLGARGRRTPCRSPGWRTQGCCSTAPTASATPPSWAASPTRSPISRHPGAMPPTAIRASSP